MNRIKLKHYLISLFMAVMILSTGVNLKAQDATEQWDLNRCINYALENNLSVNQARLRITSADAELMQARGQRLPNLSASASQNLTNSQIADMDYNGSFSVSTGVTIYNGGMINNQIQRGLKNQELSMLNLEQAQNDITLSVTQAYLNALYAKENLDYYTQVVAASEQQVVRVKALQKAGSKARKDVADIEAQYASDRYSLVNAANNLVLQTTTLKQILEIPVEDPFELYFPEAGVKEALGALPSREDAFSSALNFRPEVKSSMLQEDMTRIDLMNAKAGYLPSLSLSGRLSSSYTDSYSKGYGSQLSDNLGESLGLTLSVPIFNRNATKASVVRSQINLEIASLTVSNTRNRLLQTVERLYEDANAARQRFEAAQAQEQASSESYRLAEEQYNIGMLNAIELLQSKNNYLNASRELIQAKYTTVLYRKILDFYMGVPIVLEQ